MRILRHGDLRDEAAAVLLGHLPVQGEAEAGEGGKEEGGKMSQFEIKPGLPEKLWAAVGFAACAHREQKRKYTGEPYVNHCQNVAFIAYQYAGDLDVLKAAILHDTVEDTDVTAEEIAEAFGERVARLVLEVTDVSRPEDGRQ